MEKQLDMGALKGKKVVFFQKGRFKGQGGLFRETYQSFFNPNRSPGSSREMASVWAQDKRVSAGVSSDPRVYDNTGLKGGLFADLTCGMPHLSMMNCSHGLRLKRL